MKHRRHILLARGAALAVLAAALTLSATALAGEFSLSGSAGVEVRWFPRDPAFPDQLDGSQTSLILSPEFRWRSEERRHQFTFNPYGRIDAEDDERTHFDVREAYWRLVEDDWELLVGVNKVFWGVTESRHLVDTINQVDLVEDIDEEDRLGQQMINLAFQRNWGRLDLYVLPGFRERTFPGQDGRLRPPLVVNTGAALYESGAGDDRIDLAARWSHYIGDWDVGVHVFHGTGREPRFLVEPGGTFLIPFYDVTTQTGVDVQYTREAWLWKFEGLVREGQGDTFAAAVGGFEYTLYQIGSTAADLGLLLEYLWDGRDHTAPFTAFDHDVFVGSRLAFNDVQNTSILLGAVVDASDGSLAARLEVERRLGDHLTMEIESQWFGNIADEDVLLAFQQDSYVTAQVAWNF